jgi:hypothetical protein
MQTWFGDCKGLGYTIVGILSTNNRKFCQNLGFERRAKQHFTFVSVVLFM